MTRRICSTPTRPSTSGSQKLSPSAIGDSPVLVAPGGEPTNLFLTSSIFNPQAEAAVNHFRKRTTGCPGPRIEADLKLTLALCLPAVCDLCKKAWRRGDVVPMRKAGDDI